MCCGVAGYFFFHCVNQTQFAGSTLFICGYVVGCSFYRLIWHCCRVHEWLSFGCCTILFGFIFIVNITLCYYWILFNFIMLGQILIRGFENYILLCRQNFISIYWFYFVVLWSLRTTLQLCCRYVQIGFEHIVVNSIR